MHPSFFGDSYDLVKRSFLEWLQPLGNWAVHPMLTEAPSAEFLEKFPRLMGVPLVSEEVLEKSTDRARYFGSCKGFQHLLVDPNTGLKLSSGTQEHSPDHLLDTDLRFLVNLRPGTLTMIFDQSLQRGRAEPDLRAKLDHLRSEGMYAFAYKSHACFVFVSREPDVTESAKRLLFVEGPLPDSRRL
jgi:hypothetical protein